MKSRKLPYFLTLIIASFLFILTTSCSDELDEINPVNEYSEEIQATGGEEGEAGDIE